MNERRNLVAAMLSAVGGVGGLVAIALVIWRGGALAQVVEGLEVRVARIEINGSNGLQIHEAKDDQRVADIQHRLDRLESMLTTVARIETKLDLVKEALDDHKKQIAPLK